MRINRWVVLLILVVLVGVWAELAPTDGGQNNGGIGAMLDRWSPWDDRWSDGPAAPIPPGGQN